MGTGRRTHHVLAGVAVCAALVATGCASTPATQASGSSASRSTMPVARTTIGAANVPSKSSHARTGQPPAPSVPSSRTSGAGLFSLLSVAMTSSSNGYALAPTCLSLGCSSGDSTAVLVTTDGGAQWKTVDTISYIGREIVAPTATDAYLVAQCDGVCAGGSVIMATTDGGQSWHTVKTTSGALFALSFINSKDGWALSGDTSAGASVADAAVLHTTDGGTTWTKLPAPCNATAAGALSFVSSQEGWASCLQNPGAGQSEKPIYRTINDGQHWTLVSSVITGSGLPQKYVTGLPLTGYVHTLFFANAQDGWLGIDRVGFFATSDGGATWQYAWSSAFPPGADIVSSVGMLPSGSGWVVETNMKGSGATLTDLYTTEDHGATWKDVYPPQ